jgi:ABC-2 type transport system ATP-binding protein
MRVTEYLRFRSAIKGVPRRDRKQRVAEVIERCDISSVRRKLIGQLSKGYRQRVGLADALVADPPILILDEPTIGLDPNQIRSVRKLIRELGEKHTILLSTHILPEVEATCSRVLVINQGRIVFTESLETIRKQGAENAPIKVEVRAPEKQAQNVLTGINGVELVKCDGQEDGVVAFTVKTKSGADVREEIFQRVAKNGWALRELRREAVTLEDIFVRITAGDTPEETTS